MQRGRIPSLVLLAVTGACTPEFPEPLVPLEQIPVFAVRSVSAGFDDSSFAMLDAEGEPIYEAWVTSGVTPIGLTGAIHSDNAMPTAEVGDGTFTIIDRFGADRITRFQFPEGTVLGQMRTQGDTGESGFASNPQDVAFIDATHAFVSRYSHNLDPAADPLDKGTDLLEFDPTTMTLTGERVDLGAFNTTVAFEGDEGEVTLDVYARPARMARTASGFIVVALERISDGFETAVDGIAAIVDVETYAVTGHLLEGLQNCGVVLPVPGAPNQVAVRCLGFGPKTNATAGLVVLEISDEGEATEVATYIAAEHPDLPNVTNNVLMLSPRYFVGVEQGAWDDPQDPDIVYFVDIETSVSTAILTAPQGTDVFGSMAYYPASGIVLVPSRAEGLHRLRFGNDQIVYEDTITLFPSSLSVLDVARIL
jgi:hypothetical protein